MGAVNLQVAGATDERRWSPRTALGKPGTLRVGSDGEAVPVVVADLTRDGCRIKTDAVLDRDVDIRIGVANIGSIPGRLVWRARDSYGCAFDQPLPAGAVTAALRPTNIAHFPSSKPTAPVKWRPRAVIVLVTATIALPWTVIAGLLLAPR